MKIKKVSICGFKSFMEKLDITFSQGISGVVGPNGCGKSNVVDAIRWCMGEQSPKQLRGRRMEDVIFSGAGNHKPVGMAEVSLLFENGDGTFPTAFAQDHELSVTRRLYRSGESEYLINNVPCRLKDIQEIFMDTGLGNRAYSIIGQGQIGAIIDQRPEETRVMIEEAAGITKYRKKVEISRRRIEQTRTNLQRLEDILSEIQGQIRSLKRQAGKARRFRALSEEIRELERILYCNTFHQLREESGQREISTEALEREEISRSTLISQIHARMEEMNLELEEKDAELREHRDGFLHLRDLIHRKEGKIESLSGEIRMTEELKLRLAREKEEIRVRLSGLRDKREGLDRERDRIRKESGQLKNQINLVEERLRARKQVLREIREAYDEARADLSSGEKREMGLSNESGYINRLLEQISDSRSRLEKELKELKARSQELLRASERKNRVREANADRLSRIEDAIEQGKIEISELEIMREGMEADLKTVEAELNRSQSRLAGLAALADNFEGYNMGVRTIMKAKDFSPRKEGRILGILADLIQVDPRYERAVEAVMADRLQYVLVDSEEDGISAVQYLKEKGKGIGSFAPVKNLEGHGRVVGNVDRSLSLLDFVSAPARFMPLVKTLLGSTEIVADLDEGLSRWKRNHSRPAENGNGLTFVTLQGDMVDHTGVISGGRFAHGSRGLLKRKREMAELKKAVQVHRARVEDLKARLDEIASMIEDKKGSLEELTEDRWTCQEEINELDKALFRLGQELDQIEKMSRKISEDIERKGLEQTRHEEELLRLEQELEESREKRQKEEEYFRRKEVELREAEEEFEEYREEVARLKADYRILEEGQRSVAREMEMLDGYVDDSHKRLDTIEEDILSGLKRQEECERRKTGLEEELRDLGYRLEKAEGTMNRAERERREFQTLIKEEEKKEEGLRNEIDDLKERINTARMEHSEIRFKMNSLIEKTRERLNLNLPEIYKDGLQDDFSRRELEEKIEQKRGVRDRLGDVNLAAIKELEALNERNEFIVGQREDLIKSIESLMTAIRKINRTSLEKFKKTFHDVDQKLKEVFPILFNGGTAGLKLTDETRPLESGVIVEVQPPGKRLSHMGLLSGGEKALVAMALIFAIYMIKPSPFCLLDEVDAPLDEANIDRFNSLLQEIRRASQIIMVTHSRKTMEITDRLYGITMQERGVSKVVSVSINGGSDRDPGDKRPEG
ncbi:MAG: chromosome segregation protein SMC [Deltaproteobacteria bacterium]|nr:chromosome segregation protein SMC [Deltaproteobacteria bacterium]